MKNIYPAFVIFILMMSSLGCQQKNSTFDYHVDEFYDTEVLRYKVDGFDELTLQQKKLIYFLSQAALCGRDILYDQNGKYNLRI